ncbi:MAG: type II secretion system GspH family protein [Bacteroidales bacterium]|nr:type II secretion system GspH family protein [Bacteroidales bacterium]
MKNNKGFSLVELIIVIAIMAILVGVMAPQLIKYIEKTNVSADVQVCDTVRQAIQTAYMDPAIVTKDDPKLPAENKKLNISTIDSSMPDFYDSVKTTLGVEPKDMKLKLKSEARQAKNKGEIFFAIDKESSSVCVWVTNSDMSGKKKSFSVVDTTDGKDCSIWAGEYTAYKNAKD